MKFAKYSPVDDEQSPQGSEDQKIGRFPIERRLHHHSENRDRRVIARITVPQVRMFAMQIYRLCHWWTHAAILYVLATVGIGVYRDFRTSPKAIFYGVVILVITLTVRSFAAASASYVENESQARVEKLLERCYVMLFTMAAASVVVGGAYLISLI